MFYNWYERFTMRWFDYQEHIPGLGRYTRWIRGKYEKNFWRTAWTVLYIGSLVSLLLNWFNRLEARKQQEEARRQERSTATDIGNLLSQQRITREMTEEVRDRAEQLLTQNTQFRGIILDLCCSDDGRLLPRPEEGVREEHRELLLKVLHS